MANVFRALLAILPKTPLLVGTVVSASGAELRIELPDGTLSSARGAYNVGDTVTFRPGGAVEGTAASLPIFDIDL